MSSPLSRITALLDIIEEELGEEEYYKAEEIVDEAEDKIRAKYFVGDTDKIQSKFLS